jgi:hypothetical protein
MRAKTIAITAIITLAVIAPATLYIGDRVGTTAERCSRFWKRDAEKIECFEAAARLRNEKNRPAPMMAKQELDRMDAAGLIPRLSTH